MTPLRALALALLLAALPRPAAASGPALAPFPASVHAGDQVELSWAALPTGVEELEILLSLDDGQHYSVRVTPELDARERCYRWTVPNLPALHARLRLRLGSRHAEALADATPAFRILGGDEDGPAVGIVREGVLWTGLEPLYGGRASELFPESAGLAIARSVELSSVPPRPPIELRAPRARSTESRAPIVPSLPAPRLERAHPCFGPLRI